METLEIQEPRAETREDWALRTDAQAPTCACGCGTRIVVKPVHRTKGLPKYAHGHHSNPIRRVHQKLRKQGYVLLGEACKQLSISETTFRRLEAAAVIPHARRIEAWSGRSVRVLTERDIGQLRPTVAAWKARRR